METIKDFDDLLPHLGAWGKFQMILSAHFILIGAAYAVMAFSQTFMTLEPDDYWCYIPELERLPHEDMLVYLPKSEIHAASLASAFLDLDVDEADVKHSQCRMYDVDWRLVMRQREAANSSWPTVPCQHGWRYNMTGYFPTIVTELNWVCDSRWMPWLVQSLFYLGGMFGSAFFCYISDAYGRLKAVLSSHLLAAGAGIATGFTHSFETFLVCRILVGVAYGFGFFAMMILVLEFVDVNKRSWMTPLSSIFGIMTVSVALPWVAKYIGNWRWFAIATSAPMLLVLGFPIYLPESVRWLIEVKRTEDAFRVINNIAKLNQKDSAGKYIELYRAHIEKEQKIEKSEEHFSCVLITSRILCKYLVVSCIVWSFIAVCFDAHAWNFKDLGLDMYVAYSVSSLAELPGSLLPLFLANTLGRRLSTCLPILLAGLLSLFSPLIGKNHVVWYSMFQIASRYLVNASYNMFCQYQTEIFPTVVRSQAMGTLEAVSNIATLIAPFIIYSGFHHVYLPTLIMGILCLVSAILTLLLPETMDFHLPDTVEEAERIAKSQCLVNSIKNKLRKKKYPLTDIESVEPQDSGKKIF